MNILVIGGSGFVGHAIVRALLAEGHRLSLLNRGSRPVAGTAQLTADRNDPSALIAALRDRRFDAVVGTNCYTPRQADLLVEALGGRAPTAVVISSVAVYADNVRQPPAETEPAGGASAWSDYGRGKTEVEHVYAGAGFAAATALRPPYICGPNNNLDRETWFFRRILAGRPVLVPGSGDAWCQFVHEDDLGVAVCAWLRRAPAGFRPFNVADPEMIRSAELVRKLARAAGRDVEVRCVGTAGGDAKARDWFPFHDVHCTGDPTAFSSAFSWAPAADLDTRFAEIFRTLSETDRIPPDDWTWLEERILASLNEATGRCCP